MTGPAIHALLDDELDTVAVEVGVDMALEVGDDVEDEGDGEVGADVALEVGDDVEDGGAGEAEIVVDDVLVNVVAMTLDEEEEEEGTSVCSVTARRYIMPNSTYKMMRSLMEYHGKLLLLTMQPLHHRNNPYNCFQDLVRLHR